ncbi:hypothetical protein [Streptobacillus moniliformis]|uniref:Outer membrane protein beta-barrel domain-containing protein n=2 Tax=Streptobacillus moniliformis TaxID=34105 RepID=D1AYV0_STRM9|nr:hypothetical protein [Streptobacillus moniliformis]ACZ01476.1 hypothetical protein Smon_1011 [Streptobacillus moniliformis DSM 12112]AVL43520.1 hypothetical protein CEP89_06800 [Streptobacillus moniliformis]QXW66157.1 hypothetical protein KX935_02680 [Streptobacillus moniliformis]SQA13363.1 Uncharacterised protein [Streptobacillus moniliformis]
MKKILITLISLSIFSFSANITGPRYRLEGSVGAMNYKVEHISLRFISTSISVLPEWKAEINKKIDITFGPKATLNVTTDIQTGTTLHSNLIVGGEIDLNYRVKDDIKIYTGIEAGTGLGVQAYLSESDNHYGGIKVTHIGKLSLGVKIKERFNVALYTGYAKGALGIEGGYTF